MNSRTKLYLIGLSIGAFGLIIAFQNCAPKLALLSAQQPSEARKKITSEARKKPNGEARKRVSSDEFNSMIDTSSNLIQTTQQKVLDKRQPSAATRQKIFIKPDRNLRTTNVKSHFEFNDSKRDPQAYDAQKYEKRVIKENLDSPEE